MRSGRVLALMLVAAGPWLAATAAVAEDEATLAEENPSQQLDAIRNGLVDSALEGPTRVQSAAWIDSEGVLHENTRIRSDVEIRGFRMDQYLPEGAVPEGPPVSDVIETEIHGQDCADSLGLRPAANLTVELQASPNVREYPYLQKIAEATSQAVVRVFNGSGEWSLTERAPSTGDPYQMAVDGLMANDRAYRLRVAISPSDLIAAPIETIVWLDEASPNFASRSADGLEALRYQASRVFSELKPWRTNKRDIGAVMRIELIEPGALFAHWSDQVHLIWTDPNPGLSQPSLTATGEQQLLAVAEVWNARIRESLSCTPVRFAVIEVIQDELLIGGGTASGLRVGDRLVIADASRVPQRILEAGVADEMLMGEVVTVGPSWARLRPLTRPVPGALRTPGKLPQTFVALPL